MNATAKANLTVQELSAYLREEYGLSFTPRTLQNKRGDGTGPAYYRVSGNKVLYPKASADQWAKEVLGPAFRNTTEEQNRTGKHLRRTVFTTQ